MTADPLSKESALARVKESGRKSGAWGAPKDVNPYARLPSMQEESTAWFAGHSEGAAERKRAKA